MPFPFQKYSLCVFLLPFFVSTSHAASPKQKKYDIKSAVVTYLKVTQAGEMKIEQKHVLTFDDFGAREREDEYDAKGLGESTISVGKKTYKILHATKETYELDSRVQMIDYRFDWNTVADSDKISGRAKEVAPMTVSGRVCPAYTLSSMVRGALTTFAGWNHIMMFRDAQTDYGHNTFRAISVQENPVISASTFIPPRDYTMKKPSTQGSEKK